MTTYPTGAGNAYGGGWCAGWLASHDARVAGCYGAVAATIMVGHQGMPALTDAIRQQAADLELFVRFLDDGRVCLTNNAAERALRGVALGRKSWLFCGSNRGGERAAVMYGLIATAKLNGIDPQAWLADILGRIATIPLPRLGELLPWNWVRQDGSWVTVA